MYNQTKRLKTSIAINKSEVGEPIEHKIERIVNNKEPIKDGAPQVFTERKDGVRPEYDIRADKFEIAADAMDKVAEQKRANRIKKDEAKVIDIKKDDKKPDGGTPETGSPDGGTPKASQ